MINKANLIRYVLREQFENGQPFIEIVTAHFNLAFSCVCYLNSSLSLLPGRSTREEQIDAVLGGFHGLLHYASQYWFMHLLEYCKLTPKRKSYFSGGFKCQLEQLLAYGVNERLNGALEEPNQPREVPSILAGREALDEVPGITDLVCDILRFRTSLKTEVVGKSPEGMYTNPDHKH